MIHPGHAIGVRESMRSFDANKYEPRAGFIKAGGTQLDIEINGNVGIINYVGVTTKYGSSLIDGPSYIGTRQALRTMRNDPEIKAIAVCIDSPGGSALGVDDLYAEVVATTAVKPVCAYVDDLCASAAYYAWCGSTSLTMGSASLVGSIGTYWYLLDSSQAYKLDGLKAVIARSGEYKGIGEPGTEITDEQLVEIQREVDMMAENFFAAVAGRGVEITGELKSGKMFGANEAVTLALVDGVSTWDQCVKTANALANGEKQ